MPYNIRKVGSEYCVYNSDTDEKKGCSGTKSKATAHMRALYSAEGRSKKEISALIDAAIVDMNKEIEEIKDKEYFDDVPESIGAVAYAFPCTYAELEEAELAREREEQTRHYIDLFPYLVGNIMSNSEVENKARAVNDLAAELGRLLSEEQDTAEKGIQEIESPDTEETVFNRVVNKLKGWLGLEEEQKEESMMIWKENGQYNWIARYSNTFRDRDDPPEIISSSSHRRFVELVDKGLAPLPELWLWHQKNWKIGKATWVAYDEVKENTGFALAGGYFTEGLEHVAEWLSKRKDVLVSHGMPEPTITRDPNDKSIIIEHETREISPLPNWAAANEITGFLAFKEAEMTISAEQRKKLVEKWGLSTEVLEKIEEVNAQDAEKAISDQIETKEVETATPEVVQTQEAEILKEESVDVAAPATDMRELSQDIVSRDEIAEALRHVMTSIEALSNKIDGVSKEVDSMKEKSKAPVTQASLLQMLSGGRAVGDPSTIVKENEFLARAKPTETRTEGRTGIPFIDQMLAKN